MTSSSIPRSWRSTAARIIALPSAETDVLALVAADLRDAPAPVERAILLGVLNDVSRTFEQLSQLNMLETHQPTSVMVTAFVAASTMNLTLHDALLGALALGCECPLVVADPVTRNVYQGMVDQAPALQIVVASEYEGLS